MHKELTPPQAWQVLQGDPAAVLLDVRSKMEYEYVGHPMGAKHVSLMEPPDWQVEQQFVARVNAALAAESAQHGEPSQRPVLALCRSGKRSALAAELLLAAGFRTVSNIAEGFEGDRDEKGQRSHINGWRFHNLPWEQS